MKYFHEKLGKDKKYKVGYEIEKKVYSKKIKGKKIEIVDNALLGKIFALDGIIYFIERYEFIYSEMLAHSIMFSHSRPQRVLVISEGDRGVLREVLKHNSLKELYFIAENRNVLEIAEQCFSDLELKKVFKNPAVKAVFDDPMEYIKNFEDYFDVVILDSKDPKFRTREFFKDVLKSLTKEGMFSVFSGCFMGEAPNIKNDSKLLKNIFKHTALMKIPSVAQIFSDFGVVLSSKKINISEISERALFTRFKQFKDAKKLKYYTPETYLASMVLPKFYKEELK